MSDTAGSNRAVLGVVEQAAHTHRLRDLKQVGRQIAAAMDRHGVLTDATAMAFRMLFALAFLTLTGLAFAGAVHLEAIWRQQLGPNIAHIVSPNFYKELYRSVDEVLTTRRCWWVSGWYLANFAYRGYQQAFGVLSLLVVVMTYLYLASVAFLAGAEVDALLVAEAQKKRRA